MNESWALPINEDEGEHLQQVSEVIKREFELADVAAQLTLRGLLYSDDEIAPNEPGGLVLLLLTKAAQGLRYAVKGLLMGHYSGSTAVIRSSLEALAYAVLFQSNPKEISAWFRDEFSDRNVDLAADARQRQQFTRALDALLDMELRDRGVVRDEVERFKGLANKFIHSTMTGLSFQFGLDLGEFIPADFENVFYEAGENMQKALDLYVLVKAFGEDSSPRPKAAQTPSGEMQEFYLVGRRDEEFLKDSSIFVFYLGHRMLDFTATEFKISDEDFLKGYREWHRELKR